MDTILIELDKKKSKLITDLAKSLGGKVIAVSKDKNEDLLLGIAMKKIKTDKNVSRAAVRKN